MILRVLKKCVSVFIILSLVTALSSAVYSAQKGISSDSPKLININNADAAELIKLPRVGEKIAQRIIDYRNKNGKFKRPADIMKVKGIGEKTFEMLKKLITVGSASKTK